MLTIYNSNKKYENDFIIDVQIIKDMLEIKLSNKKDIELKEYNPIPVNVKLESYTTYALVSGDTYIQDNKNLKLNNCMIVSLSRLGTAIKEDFGILLKHFNYAMIMQIDTGIISDTEKDIVFTPICINNDDIHINSDIKYKFDDDTNKPARYPRMWLWDNYSLTIDNKEYKSDRWGNIIDNNKDNKIQSNSDYIEFTIKKYKGYFTNKSLKRDIDNEEIFIETSAGLCNPRRINLVNGEAKFKVYPFNYKGRLKVKIGSKWYSPWNDYEFELC